MTQRKYKHSVFVTSETNKIGNFLLFSTSEKFWLERKLCHLKTFPKYNGPLYFIFTNQRTKTEFKNFKHSFFYDLSEVSFIYTIVLLLFQFFHCFEISYHLTHLDCADMIYDEAYNASFHNKLELF